MEPTQDYIIQSIREQFPQYGWYDLELRELSYDSTTEKMSIPRSAIIGVFPQTQNEYFFGIVNPKTYTLIQPEVVLYTALQRFKDNFGEVSVNVKLQGPRYNIELDFPSMEGVPVQVGDLVTPRFSFRGASTGGRAISLIPGATQLVCSNGLIVPYDMGLVRVVHTGHSDLTLTLQMDQINAFMSDHFAEYAKRWAVWSETPITMVQIDDVWQRADWPFCGTQEKGGMKYILDLPLITVRTDRPTLRALLDSDSATVWHFHNAVTQYVTHKITSARSQMYKDVRTASVFNDAFPV